MEMTRLSILICSIPSRLEKMSKLIAKLERQIKDKPVEILYIGDNKKRTIGSKRNDLLLLAKGDYSCFIDDDDDVSEDYVDRILEASEKDTDCIVFQAIRTVDGQNGKLVKYSILYKKDENRQDYFIRLPNHLMPIKTDILLSTFFKEVSFGEDFDLAHKIKAKLISETRIDKVLYYYLDKSKKKQ